jgi:hypothetical protein
MFACGKVANNHDHASCLWLKLTGGRDAENSLDIIHENIAGKELYGNSVRISNCHRQRAVTDPNEGIY